MRSISFISSLCIALSTLAPSPGFAEGSMDATDQVLSPWILEIRPFGSVTPIPPGIYALYGEDDSGAYSPTLAGRYKLDANTAVRGRVSLSLMAENDEEGQPTAAELGLGVDYLKFLRTGRCTPYLVGGGDLLKRGGDGFNSYFALSLSGGVGVEVELLDGVSLGGESRAGLNLSPLRLGTIDTSLFVTFRF